jgi:hypothetical protein
MQESKTHVGDTIDGVISWEGDPDLAAWSGKPVRLVFVMTECDLYSFRFEGEGEKPSPSSGRLSSYSPPPNGP